MNTELYSRMEMAFQSVKGARAMTEGVFRTMGFNQDEIKFAINEGILISGWNRDPITHDPYLRLGRRF